MKEDKNGYKLYEGSMQWDMRIESLDGIKNYALAFFKEDQIIAAFIWHPICKEITMSVHIALRKQTLKELEQYYNPKIIRFFRKRWKASLRKRKYEKINKERKAINNMQT